MQRLDNLDIFSSIDAVPAADGDGVALTIEVRELPFAVPYLTYDVTDQDGWSFGPALKSVNMMGRDIYVAGFALFGGKASFLFDLNYPWMAGNHLSLDLTLARIERENILDGFRETTFELSPWLGTYLKEHGRARVGVSYFRARGDAPGHTLSKDGLDWLFRIGAGAGWDSRDVWSNPHEGWFNEIEVVKTGGVLFGDGDFWTAHLDVRRFQPVGATHTLVLAGLLSLQSGTVGHSLPEYLDFHLGGANSIRGYQLEELGRDLYGKNQWIGTAEYRFPVTEPREYRLLGLRADLGLAGALFADAGLAWSRDADFTLDRARMGYGLGLRLLMPAVDMTRLDVGFDQEGNWRLHLAVFSKLEAQRFRLR
jgi:outer membrane protein assembly factor BamA